MSILDQVGSFLRRISGNQDPERRNSESNLANGGHTGYHPVAPRHQRRVPELEQAQAYPPVNMNQTGAFQPSMGTGVFQQPTYQTGYQPQFQAGAMPVQGTYQPQPMTGYVPQGTGYQSTFQPQETSWQYGQAAAPEVNPAQNGNISYMPGSFVGDDGQGYRMVQRLAQPLSAASCYRLIEFMRNGESIIVNTEMIRDEYENTRCLDLLYGAAFTMGCTFTRISSRSIYLISPASVMVMPYESIREMSDADQQQRWPGSVSRSGVQAESPRRGFSFRSFEEDSSMDQWGQARYSRA